MRPYFAYCAFLHALLHAVFSTFYRIFLSQYVNELSFLSEIVENNGVEPLTSCVQGRRSSQLS